MANQSPPPSGLAARIDRCRKNYEDLWTKIANRHNLGRQNNNRPVRIQSRVASDLSESPSNVSRVLNGNRVPRSHELLVKLAATYKARKEETRTLLAWASALTAFDNDEFEVAQHFLEMFRPLYAEGALTARLISPCAVAYNTLIDLKVPRELANQIAADEELSRSKSVQEAIGHVVSLLGKLGVELAPSSYKQLPDLIQTYRRIVVVDFESPFTDQSSAVKDIHRAERRGDCEPSKVWRAIPHVVMTRIVVKAGRRVSDTRHEGFEFLFLEKGSGVFRLKDAGEVCLSQQQRQLIAYRPSGSHSFTADANRDAVLYIISYSRAGDEDPTDDILKAASEPDLPSALPRRRRRTARTQD